MRLEEIQLALREEAFDGWLFFDHHLRDPLAYEILGFQPASPPSRRWYYLIPAQGEPRKLCHRIEAGVLDSLPGARELYASWREQEEQLRRMLDGCRVVAMQYSPRCEVPYVSMVDGGTLELVRSAGVEVASSANLVQTFQALWDQRMLDSHMEAGRRVDAIRREAFLRIRDALGAHTPIDEYDVWGFIRDAIQRSGLYADHGPIVAVNANASDPHYEPSSGRRTPIRPGDLVLIDLWAKLKQPGAVYYDITWTGYCGQRPPDHMSSVFEVVTRARDTAVSFVRQAVEAGRPVRGFEVDDVARAVIRQAGFGEHFFHRTGHSIGSEVHGAGVNMDNFETHDVRRLLPGCCFSVEPGIYLNEFGIRSEVNVFVSRETAFVTGEIQHAILKLA